MPYAGQLAALGTALCWVGTALSFEAAGKRIGSLTVNLLRLVIAAGLLALEGWVVRGLALPLDAPPRAWLWLSVSGLVGFTFGDLCLFRAFVVLGSRLSTLMMALAPPLTAVLGFLVLGEVLSGRDLARHGADRRRRGVGGARAATERRRPPRRRRRAPRPRAGRHQCRGVRAVATRAASRGCCSASAAPSGRAAAWSSRSSAWGATTRSPPPTCGCWPAPPATSCSFSALGWWRRVPAAVRDRRAVGLTAVGAFFGPFLGVSLSLVAVQLVPAGVAASLMATTPVLIIPVVVLLGRERVGLGGIAGALLAVAGVALLFL